MVFAPWTIPELCPRGEQTIGESFLRRVLLTPRNVVYQWRGPAGLQKLTFEEALGELLQAYHFAKEQGVQRGDRVALTGPSSLSWHLLDLALLSMGAVVVPLYSRAAASDMSQILEETGARSVFYTGDECPPPLSGRAVKFERGASLVLPPAFAFDFARAVSEVRREHVATVIYTSGTSGRPKGVERTHAQLVGEAQALVTGMLLDERDGSLSAIPLAHVMGRLESFLPLFSGGRIAFSSGPESLAGDFALFQPTFFIGVPRLFERLLEKMMGSTYSRRAKHRAVRLLADYGTSRYRNWREGGSRHIVARAALKAIDLALWKRVRLALGGKMRFAVCGGAALAGAVEDYFELFSVPIYQAYGLTETGGAVAMNLPHRARPRTVGLPLFGVNLRLADDGEVEVSGELVLKQYFGNREETRDSFTADGWYRTGDIGELDEDGYLRLVDRKKEMFVTTGGRKVAPVKVEIALRGSPLVAHVVILGDGRPFISALLSLNWEAVTDWACDVGVRGFSISELARHPRLLALLQEHVNQANETLAAYEQVRSFQVLDEPLAIHTETLTPSMKIRREACERRYRGYIEEIYDRGTHTR